MITDHCKTSKYLHRACQYAYCVGHMVSLLQAHNACITDMQEPDDEAVGVPTSSFPVVLSDESKLVRTPGLEHQHIVVASEVRESGSTSTMPDSSQTNLVFPKIAIYCHPPSPTVSPYSGSPSPPQCSPHYQNPTESPRPTMSNVEEATAGVKQPVCARLSVPTDGPLRRRAASGSLSRSQSHPLHRQRHRSSSNTSNFDELGSCSQQTGRLKNVVERTS